MLTYIQWCIVPYVELAFSDQSYTMSNLYSWIYPSYLTLNLYSVINHTLWQTYIQWSVVPYVKLTFSDWSYPMINLIFSDWPHPMLKLRYMQWLILPYVRNTISEDHTLCCSWRMCFGHRWQTPSRRCRWPLQQKIWQSSTTLPANSVMPSLSSRNRDGGKVLCYV